MILRLVLFDYINLAYAMIGSKASRCRRSLFWLPFCVIVLLREQGTLSKLACGVKMQLRFVP